MTAHATIKLGSQSDDVKLAQALLNRVLAPSPGLGEDGHFGDQTRIAVVAFQHGEGIQADGVVGPGTWKRLLARAEVGSGPAAEPAPAPEPPPHHAKSELGRRGLSVYHAARVELARGAEKHGHG